MARLVRLGIIGTGTMAREVAYATKVSRCAQLVAFASRNPERSETLAREMQLSVPGLNYEDLLRRNDIDAVYIANENSSHMSATLAAIEMGKAVLCEKPLGTSLAEVSQMTSAARRRGVLLMEAISTPFLPSVAQALAAVGTARYGKAKLFAASFGYPEDRETSPSLFKPDSGVLLDRMIYLVTLATLIHGPTLSISVSSTCGSGIDHSAVLQINHTSGACSQLAASFGSVLSNDAWIGCQHAVIRIDEPLLKAELIRVGLHTVRRGSGGGGTSYFSRFAPLRLLNAERRHFRREHRSFGRSHLEGMLKHFCRLAGDGAQESPVLSFMVIEEVHRVLDMTRRQAR